MRSLRGREGEKLRKKSTSAFSPGAVFLPTQTATSCSTQGTVERKSGKRGGERKLPWEGEEARREKLAVSFCLRNGTFSCPRESLKTRRDRSRWGREQLSKMKKPTFPSPLSSFPLFARLASFVGAVASAPLIERGHLPTPSTQPPPKKPVFPRRSFLCSPFDVGHLLRGCPQHLRSTPL